MYQKLSCIIHYFFMLRGSKASASLQRSVVEQLTPISGYCTAAEPVTERKKYSVSPKEALPQFVAGRWRTPKLSARKMAMIKKDFLGSYLHAIAPILTLQ